MYRVVIGAYYISIYIYIWAFLKGPRTQIMGFQGLGFRFRVYRGFFIGLEKMYMHEFIGSRGSGVA